MRRRSRRVLALTLVLLVVTGGLGGCTLSPVTVAVVGHDADGTLVVGGTDCSVGGSPPRSLEVRHTSEVTGVQTLWAVERRTSSSRTPTTVAPTTAQPPPPSPTPLRVDEVALLSVGDPGPAGWRVVTPLEQPLPEGGRIELEVRWDATTASTTTLEAPPGRVPDRYAASVGDLRLDQVDGAGLLEAVRDTCDEATAFDGGRFTAIVGGTVVGLVVAGVLLGVVTARQARRAGRAAAERWAASSPPRPW